MIVNKEQLLAHSPDEASTKAGLTLANNSKWISRNVNSLALWGECQGSGKNPYKTAIDLHNVAFKCNCPSRKFPCKHGLGLFLLYLDNPNCFNTEINLPIEIKEWIEKKNSKNEKLDKTENTEKPIDDIAKQKRKDAREKKILNGIDELQSWIKDLIRGGIVNLPQNSYHFTRTIISRMIDSQASGLAYQLRKINSIDFYKENWQQKLLKQVSLIYSLAEAYKNKHSQPDLIKEELLTLIGWTKNKEEILSTEAIKDNWFVLSKISTIDENLRVETVWLYGNESKKIAQILSYYAGNQISENVYLAGMQFSAELCYYPSIFPLRALIKNKEESENEKINLKGTNLVHFIQSEITKSRSLFPFIEKIPFILIDFIIVLIDKNAFLKDSQNKVFEINNTQSEIWTILAITKGKPFNCFSIYEDDKLLIISILNEDIFYSIK